MSCVKVTSGFSGEKRKWQTSYGPFYESITSYEKAERCYNEIGAPETKIKGILNILVLTPRAKISDPVLGLIVIAPPPVDSPLLTKFVKSFLIKRAQLQQALRDFQEVLGS